MAVITWNDVAGDGNLNTSTNWVGNTAPAFGDTAVIATGARDITAGTIACTSLRITSGFKYNFGTTSAALTVNCNNAAGTIDVAVAGGFVKITGASVPNTTLKVQFSSSGTFGLAGGTFLDTSFAGPGEVVIESGAVPTVAGINGPKTSILGTSGTALGTLVLGAGTVESERDITAAYTNPATKLTMKGDATIGTAIVGGSLNDQSSGTFTTVHLLTGAVYSPDGTPATGKTIATLYRHQGSTFISDAGGFEATVTADKVV